MSDLAIDSGAVALGIAASGSLLALVRIIVRGYSSELHVHAQSRRARAALTEASLEEEWFAPEVMRATVDEILEVAASVWRDGRLTLLTRSDGRLIERWAHSVTAWLRTDVELAGDPTVDVLRVINRPGEAEDRVVLRVRLRLRRLRRELGDPHISRADLRWTLGRRNGRWTVLSMDGNPLAPSILERDSIPAAWADDERLREQSLLELADADAVRPTADLSELVPADIPVDQQLTDLAEIDRRFDPDLLAARIAHIVDAWEEATTGAAEPLANVTVPEALARLLYPPRGDAENRLVLRDATVDRWTATQLVLSATPPQIDVDVEVSAVRYMVSNRTGEQLGGNVDVPTSVPLSWTLTLTATRPAVWQLTATTNPAEGLRDFGETTDP